MNKLFKNLIVFVVVLLIILVPICIFFSHRSTMVSLQERINSQYASNKSSYDNMWKKFKEMAQVTDLQANNFKKVYDDIITGRYKDTNLLFKMVKENNPNLDQKTYINLQNEIGASRNNFDNNQKEIADIIREYNTYVRVKFITAAIFNFRTVDSNKYIITSDRTSKAFDSGKDSEIDLSK